MSRNVGWGIVGCGDVADRKAGASFNAIPDSQLVSVMRRDAARAEEFALKHGAAHWSTSAADVIQHPEVDVIYVATPPGNQLEYALAVAEAGKPCLVEKPAGRSLAEFQRMRQAFRNVGLPLHVSFYRRHLPRFLKVKAILDSGVLGSIVSIDYRMTKPAPPDRQPIDAAVTGGGSFYDLACHMLDLFDLWFGALEHDGASATNLIPRETTEDAVALSFRTQSGAVGNALWNFAASRSGDELVIDGTRGRITMKGTSVSKPVKVEFERAARMRVSQSRYERWYVKYGENLGLPIHKTFRFKEADYPHRNLIQHVTAKVAAGDNGDNADDAMRTARIVDRALDDYYGGREDAFWTRPESWKSLQAQASSRNQQPLPAEFRVSEDELQRFETQGYIGPFQCDAEWQKLIVPVKKGRGLHLVEEDLFNVCTHPSVVRRVAQVMGRSRFSLFKARFVVKMPNSEESEVAWHQDVGDRNGGFMEDGKAVPTLSVWMAIDKSDMGNGALQVIPGSHLRLVGNYNKHIRSELIESGAVTEQDLQRAQSIELKPGEFIIFHSWLLHGSQPNRSDRRRAGLNMRFSPEGMECEQEFVYVPIETSPVEQSDRLFVNEVWEGEANIDAGVRAGSG